MLLSLLKIVSDFHQPDMQVNSVNILLSAVQILVQFQILHTTRFSLVFRIQITEMESYRFQLIYVIEIFKKF